MNTAITIDNAVILIELDGTNAGAGANGFVLTGTASGSTLRGLAINRFGRVGISLLEGDNNIISGNFIGTDTTGTLARANNFGIATNVANGAIIGGTTGGAGNLISGNTNDGIGIGFTGNMSVHGNRIGTAADGVSALANTGDGIKIATSGGNNQIGGIGANEGNIIAFNNEDGVQITDVGASPVNNPILSNSIYSNGGLGINLSIDGVTPNDAGDADNGANNLQNFPVITAAQSGSTRVIGTFNSTASTTFRLEFFNSPTVDPSGSGEGQFFVGAVNVLTDGSGNAVFDQTFAPNSPLNSYISATATNLTTNDTSEFSNVKQVLSPTAAPVSIGVRFLTADGRGVFGSRVKMSDSNGNVRLVMTNSFGRFSFAEVAAGETYIFTVSHKRYRFSTQILSAFEDRDDLNFVAPGKLFDIPIISPVEFRSGEQIYIQK